MPPLRRAFDGWLSLIAAFAPPLMIAILLPLFLRLHACCPLIRFLFTAYSSPLLLFRHFESAIAFDVSRPPPLRFDSSRGRFPDMPARPPMSYFSLPAADAIFHYTARMPPPLLMFSCHVSHARSYATPALLPLPAPPPLMRRRQIRAR